MQTGKRANVLTEMILGGFIYTNQAGRSYGAIKIGLPFILPTGRSYGAVLSDDIY